MAQIYSNRIKKITFNIPLELKEQVVTLKEKLHVSLALEDKKYMSALHSTI